MLRKCLIQENHFLPGSELIEPNISQCWHFFNNCIFEKSKIRISEIYFYSFTFIYSLKLLKLLFVLFYSLFKIIINSSSTSII